LLSIQHFSQGSSQEHCWKMDERAFWTLLQWPKSKYEESKELWYRSSNIQLWTENSTI